jgi:hypothetical protein
MALGRGSVLSSDMPLHAAAEQHLHRLGACDVPSLCLMQVLHIATACVGAGCLLSSSTHCAPISLCGFHSTPPVGLLSRQKKGFGFVVLPIGRCQCYFWLLACLHVARLDQPLEGLV